MDSRDSQPRSRDLGPSPIREVMLANQGSLTSVLNIWDLAAMGFAEGLIKQLKRLHATVEKIRFGTISPHQMVGPDHRAKGFRASRFVATGESLLFSRFIAETMVAAQEVLLRNRIVDLACGASLPTLSALLQTSTATRQRQLLGVDVDRQAVIASRENAAALGLGHCSTFIQDDLLTFVTDKTHFADAMIVANPPYVPVPENLSDPWFLPVHGGKDGIRFIKAILTAPMQPETPVVLFANSVSSPAYLFEQIETSFNILRLSTYLAPFGRYLNDERLLPHLEVMRNAGAISFGVDSERVRQSLILGFLLSKR